MKTEKRKISLKSVSIFGVLLLALGAAVYLNFNHFAPMTGTAVSSAVGTTIKHLGDAKYVNATVATTGSKNYFSEMRTSRDEEYNKSLDALNSIINNVRSTDDAKNTASKEVTRLTANREAQQNIESLILAKGFDECIAVINGENISVAVKCASSGLLTSETRQIEEIIMSSGTFLAENIKIIEIKQL